MSRSITVHWNFRQQLHYFFFLVLNHQQLASAKRANRFFHNMSVFLLDQMTNSQCRTHHQKRVQNYEKQEDYMVHFFQDHYQQRMLGVSHLKRQILACLNQLKRQVERAKANQEQRKLTLTILKNYEEEGIDQILGGLRLEERLTVVPKKRDKVGRKEELERIETMNEENGEKIVVMNTRESLLNQPDQIWQYDENSIDKFLDL